MERSFGWRQLLAWPLIALVRVYQVLVSPMLGPTCRYYPSCSSYAVEALRMHGPLRGTWLAGRRLLRCHPWSAGGVDHVPARKRAPMTDRPTDGVETPAPPNPRTPWAS